MSRAPELSTASQLPILPTANGKIAEREPLDLIALVENHVEKA